MSRTRRRIDGALKAKIALEALREQATIAELEEAMRRHGRPEVFNTDQGSQFTCEAFVGTLLGAEICGVDGWPRPLDGQRLHRAAVALAQARRGLPEGLCGRARGAGRYRRVDRVLQ